VSKPAGTAATPRTCWRSWPCATRSSAARLTRCSPPRGCVGRGARKPFAAAASALGAEVLDFALRDVTLTAELRHAFAATALAREQGRAKLEHARADAAVLRSSRTSRRWSRRARRCCSCAPSRPRPRAGSSSCASVTRLPGRVTGGRVLRGPPPLNPLPPTRATYRSPARESSPGRRCRRSILDATPALSKVRGQSQPPSLADTR
jgi:hypothetical protein